MLIYSWEGIPQEPLKESLWRKVINGERITLAQVHYTKGAEVPLHHHENEQFSFVISGALQFELEGKRVALRPGEVIHVPPNIPHRVVALEESLGVDIFSPIRQDWLVGQDDYLRGR